MRKSKVSRLKSQYQLFKSCLLKTDLLLKHVELGLVSRREYRALDSLLSATCSSLGGALREPQTRFWYSHTQGVISTEEKTDFNRRDDNPRPRTKLCGDDYDFMWGLQSFPPPSSRRGDRGPA